MANILPHETYHQAIKIFKRCLEIFQKNGFLHYSSKKSSSLVVQFWLAKQIKDLSRCISIPISHLPQFCLSESILGEEVEVNWLVIIVKEEVGMRSDSYNSHPKTKTTTKKIRQKSLWHFWDIPVCSAGRIQPAVGWYKNKPSRNMKFFKTRLEKLIKIMLLRRVLRETELHRQNYMFSRFGWGVLFSKGKNCSCSKANWCHLVSLLAAPRGAALAEWEHVY